MNVGWKNGVGRGRATAMIGGLAVLGLLAAGCGDDNKASGAASVDQGSTSATGDSSGSGDTASTTTSRTPAGFTTTQSEMESMLADAEAGITPVYCEVAEVSGTMHMWLAGENQFKIEMRTDNDGLGTVRLDSTLWIWSEEDGEGLKMTGTKGDLSEMDSSVMFMEAVENAPSVKCKQESGAATLAAPSEITFYTQADVASGKYSNEEAQALLEKFDSLGE